MLKILSPTDNKGSVYSPFIIAALILITFCMSLHLTETASAKKNSIESGSRIRKTVSDMEEIRSGAGTRAFLAAGKVLSPGGNRTTAELEKEIAAAMKAHVGKMAGVSSLTGNYTFSLLNISGGRLLLVSVAAPRACINRSAVIVCADLGIEQVIDKRWIS
jgi:hypothetical protein